MRFLLSTVAVAALLAMSAAADSQPNVQSGAATISTPSRKSPPRSDGSSGSFNGQFGSGGCLVWLNTDTGQVWCSDSGGFVIFTVPYKVVKWKKQTFHAYNFTDMTVQPSVRLTIYGTQPAMFLATQDISFAGQFTIAAAAGAGGAAPTPEDPNGNSGGSATNTAGGGGGSGAGGGVEGQCSEEYYTGGGGGGGANLKKGQSGLPGDYPVDAGGTPINNPPGPGGLKEPAHQLIGGGGGGSGGGTTYGGDFYGFPGANGGGAVLFSTKGSINILSGAIIDASGANGIVSQGFTGSSGGGAGGDEWFYAQGSFTNAGTLNTQGGEGGKSTYTSGCSNPTTVKGPDGGNGGGGNLVVNAAKIDNAGTIDVSDGGHGKSFVAASS
jgi:hypothetical protein